jgi:hypothetical protein
MNRILSKYIFPLFSLSTLSENFFCELYAMKNPILKLIQ